MKSDIIRILKTKFPDKKIISVNEPLTIYKSKPIPMYSLMFVSETEIDEFTNFVNKDSTVIFVYKAEITSHNGLPALILRTNQI
jgi:hypothetical protein